MRRIVLLLTLLISSIIIMSFCSVDRCITGKGAIKTEVRDIKGFTSLDISAIAEVNIHYGKDWSVKVTDYENLLPNLVTELQGETLKVYNKTCVRRSKCVIDITMPKLQSLEMEGIGEINIEGDFEPVKVFQLNYSGIGELNLNANVSKVVEIKGSSIGDFNVNFKQKLLSLNIELSGVGDVTIKGPGTDKLYLDVSGTGEVDLSELPAKYAVVKANGIGEVSVKATETLKIYKGGIGEINYYGNPKNVEYIKD